LGTKPVFGDGGKKQAPSSIFLQATEKKFAKALANLLKI